MSLTVSEAIAIFERAFRAKDPNEIERELRPDLNVRVAVIDSLRDTENKINSGYYPITIRVPYWVFISKLKEKNEKEENKLEVYVIGQENIISEESKKWKLEKISSLSDILPNKTYFLLKHEAGYYSDVGLTFDGEGETTGFEKIEEGEKTEKLGVGREQTWEEHAIGAYNRADKILKIYRPFLTDWAKSIFSNQNLTEEQIEETAEAIILAIKISVFLHDIGKLRKKWQEAVGWQAGQPYLARTSNKRKVPFHAPYAYPFLKTLLRDIFGEYRFLDTIALATARHHSLEVTGAVRENDFELVEERIVEFLLNLLLGNISELKTYGKEKLKEHLLNSVRATNKGSFMDEPPSPSDDFYFMYAITNRVVKFADWEDAGNEIIELPEMRG